MCNNINIQPKENIKAPSENQEAVILEDVDDLIFGDERTVPSSR